VTQQGDANGGSFGISLLNFHTGFGRTTLLLILLGTVLLVRIMSRYEKELIHLLRHDSLLTSIIFAYLGLYAAGTHFIYRLMILVPIALLLWKNSSSAIIPYYILALMITSRLNIVVVTSSILSFYFIFLAVKYFIFKANVDPQLK